MGLLTRYTSTPIHELELSTNLETLETTSGHDSSAADFFPSPERTEDQTPTRVRRLWDCLDSVEFMLDVSC